MLLGSDKAYGCQANLNFYKLPFIQINFQPTMIKYFICNYKLHKALHI